MVRAAARGAAKAEALGEAEALLKAERREAEAERQEAEALCPAIDLLWIFLAT